MATENETQNDRTFPATVVDVVNYDQVAINRGSNHGVDVGDRFAIYGFSDEDIIDPDTQRNLGKLEIFKGNGKVINVQPEMSTIKSTETKPARKEVFFETKPGADLLPLNPFFNRATKKIIEFPAESLPFNNPQRGDKAKPI